MRDLVLKMAISVDGFVSDLSGANTWMFGADQEAKAWNVDYLWTAGLHIMGSRSFNAMAPYWATSTDPFAPPMNQIPKAVFSRQGSAILGPGTPTAAIPQTSGLQAGGESWAQAYVAGGDLTEEIAKLKAQGGKPIIAHGGVSFARSLVSAGLVDQFTLVTAPVALGQGMSVFSDLAQPLRLKLESSKAFPGGAVAQIYRKV